VPIVRIIIIAVVALTSAGQVFQERRRLDVVRRLPGREARDYYEATRERAERSMTIVTIVLALAAAGALVATFGRASS
jgi:hypothetical protein